MLGAFADGKDIGIGGAHLVVDDDAAFDQNARRLGGFDVRPDADGHDQQRRRNDAAILQLQAFDVSLAEDGFGLGAEHRDDAAFQ